MQAANGHFPESDWNGLIEGFITLAEAKAEKLLRSQGVQHGWLTYTAVSKDPHGVGHVQLIAPEGRSVISDNVTLCNTVTT